MQLWIAPIYVKISIGKVTITKMRNRAGMKNTADCENLVCYSGITPIGVDYRNGAHVYGPVTVAVYIAFSRSCECPS